MREFEKCDIYNIFDVCMLSVSQYTDVACRIVSHSCGSWRRRKTGYTKMGNVRQSRCTLIDWQR